MSFVFYDIETTGIETAFDQILQFAAIKTDNNFTELDRLDIRCRLLPHIVPSPGALLTTRVMPEKLIDPHLPTHYEAIRVIQETLARWSPATFVGFNSLAFDEPLLRQAFFQTLHHAYLTNTNGNSRLDVMRIAHAVSVYDPSQIVVPTDEQRRPTFRLDRLAPANGYDHKNAHEAMADVEATLHLARAMRTRSPQVWRFMERTKTKRSVHQLLSGQAFISLTERHFGDIHSWFVTPCGQNPNNDSEVAVFDLTFDPDPYLSMQIDEILDVLNGTPKVIRSLRANSQPIIMPPEMVPVSVKDQSMSSDELQRRSAAIKRDAAFRDRVGDAQALRFTKRVPSPYVELRLYDGFPSSGDRALMAEFHASPWSDRVTIIERMDDWRIKEFAYRLLYFERPHLLPDERTAEIVTWIRRRMLTEDTDVPWMTVRKALSQADELLMNATSEETTLLEASKQFILGLGGHAGRGK